MPNQAGIDFNTGTYQGKDANSVYHGYRGSTMNPQTSDAAKSNSAAVMNSLENAARNTSAGYNGVIHNPQTSDAAKSSAASKMGNMSCW